MTRLVAKLGNWPIPNGTRHRLFLAAALGALLCSSVAQDVPEAARKAVARRQEMVAKADEAALKRLED